MLQLLEESFMVMPSSSHQNPNFVFQKVHLHCVLLIVIVFNNDLGTRIPLPHLKSCFYTNILCMSPLHLQSCMKLSTKKFRIIWDPPAPQPSYIQNANAKLKTIGHILQGSLKLDMHSWVTKLKNGALLCVFTFKSPKLHELQTAKL